MQLKEIVDSYMQKVSGLRGIEKKWIDENIKSEEERKWLESWRSLEEVG